MPVKPRCRARPGWPRVLLSLVLLAVLVPSSAGAGGGASCGLSATTLAFGTYVPSSGSPSDFTATITLTCIVSGTTPIPIHGTISLISPGARSGRQLGDGAHRLRYQLYLDPARTVLWGDAGDGDATAAISGVVGPTNPFRQVLTVYGRILARQSDARVGNYGDQITVVLNY
jgi:spore coat protein U-like protein